MFSCQICEIFKNTFFYGTPPVVASAKTHFRSFSWQNKWDYKETFLFVESLTKPFNPSTSVLSCSIVRHFTKSFILPTGIYLLKVNNRNTRTRCKICSKLTIKLPDRRHCVFLVSFEHISHLVLVFLLTLKHVISGWVMLFIFRLIYFLETWYARNMSLRVEWAM